MTRLISNASFPPRRKVYRCYLAISWCCGILSGFLVYRWVDSTVLSLMRGTPYAPVSIVCFLCVSVLPVLLSAFAVFLSSPVLVLLICFAKALLFAFVSLGVYQAFASAGWLMRLLLLFGECITLPLLYLFWLRGLSSARRPGVLESLWMLSLALLAGSIHACVISPFLACLIEI